MYGSRKLISIVDKTNPGAVTIPPFLTGCGNTSTPPETINQAGQDAHKGLKDLEIESLMPAGQNPVIVKHKLL